jgi:hypothetical protein
VRGWRTGRRSAREIALTETPGFWRRLFGPFFAPVVAIVIAIGVLVGGIALRYAFYTSADQAAVKDAPRISDTSFEQAAQSVCKQYVVVFDTATTIGQDPTSQQSGQFLENIATTFDDMVTKLSAISVAPPDRSAVSAWLADWRTYDAYGHEYAAAVSQGAERDLVHNDLNRIDAILRRRNGFAKANHMGSCAFR